MEIEKRKQGKKTKFYLAQSTRIGKKVTKIRRYLGSNLTKKDIEKLLPKARVLLQKKMEEHKNPLLFELTAEEINLYRKYDSRIKISHLKKGGWKKFTEKFTYNTNAIEGSTISASDVNDILRKKSTPLNDEEVESVNVANALEYIKVTKEELSTKLMNKLHKLCFHGTKHFAGKLREVHVLIKDANGNIIHEGANPDELGELLKRLCKWYSLHKNVYSPLLLASVIHNQFEKIHPYQDGNGRVGRLLLNYVLLKHKYPPVNIYLNDRIRYYECLRIFDKYGDVKPTLKFLINQYKKQR